MSPEEVLESAAAAWEDYAAACAANPDVVPLSVSEWLRERAGRYRSGGTGGW